jgi:ribosomal protein L35
MPKIKTRRTLLKRVRITTTGKVMKKQNGNGHLKGKMDSSRKHRKHAQLAQPNRGHIKVLKKMLGKTGRGL